MLSPVLAALRDGLGLWLLVAAAAPAAPPPSAQQAAFTVVVHPANSASTVTRDFVSRLFLKKVSRWADGTTAAPVDLRENDPVREAFSRGVHGRSARAVRAYWQEMIFSGRAAPPPEVPWEPDVLAWVRGHPGGIGYVSAATPPEGVKVLELAAE